MDFSPTASLNIENYIKDDRIFSLRILLISFIFMLIGNFSLLLYFFNFASIDDKFTYLLCMFFYNIGLLVIVLSKLLLLVTFLKENQIGKKKSVLDLLAKIALVLSFVISFIGQNIAVGIQLEIDLVMWRNPYLVFFPIMELIGAIFYYFVLIYTIFYFAKIKVGSIWRRILYSPFLYLFCTIKYILLIAGIDPFAIVVTIFISYAIEIIISIEFLINILLIIRKEKTAEINYNNEELPVKSEKTAHNSRDLIIIGFILFLFSILNHFFNSIFVLAEDSSTVLYDKIDYYFSNSNWLYLQIRLMAIVLLILGLHGLAKITLHTNKKLVAISKFILISYCILHLTRVFIEQIMHYSLIDAKPSDEINTLIIFTIVFLVYDLIYWLSIITTFLLIEFSMFKLFKNNKQMTGPIFISIILVGNLLTYLIEYIGYIRMYKGLIDPYVFALSLEKFYLVYLVFYSLMICILVILSIQVRRINIQSLLQTKYNITWSEYLDKKTETKSKNITDN